MARIRTIKPEFWTDEKVVECSISARLLFIGLFNFANDKGCMERSPRRIKMQVFPADSMDCEPLIQELIVHGLLTEYSVNGVQYLHITGFLKHQKINRPSQSNIPLPPDFNASSVNDSDGEDNNSMNTHGVITEQSMSDHYGLTDGKEGKGKDLKDKTPHNAQARESDYFSGDQQFQMFDGWCPSGEPRQEYTSAELEDFVLFWSAGGQLFNQTQWEQKFTRSVQRYRQHAKTKKSGGSHAKQNTANASAFGRVRARHNEWRISQGLEPLGDDDEAVWPPLGPEERGGTLHDLDPGDFEVLG